MYIVHRYQIQRSVCALFFSFVLVGSVVSIATAQEQTVTLAFYQGLNLEQDEVVSTPEVISVVFCGTATEPFIPALDRDLYAFPAEVDLFLPYHPQPDQALWLAAGDGAQVMRLAPSHHLSKNLTPSATLIFPRDSGERTRFFHVKHDRGDGKFYSWTHRIYLLVFTDVL